MASLEDMLGSFFNPERGYEAGMDELRKYFEQGMGALSPYQQRGMDQYGILRSGISELINPANLMSKFISSYQESPYTKQLIDQSRQRGLQDASSMGLMGSSAALGNIQQGASNIAASQREQYLKDLMGTYLSGLGLSSNIYGTGARAAGDIANLSGRMGENMAGLAYGRQNAPGGLFGNLLGLGANLLGSFL